MFESVQLEGCRQESGGMGLPYPICTAPCGSNPSATQWKDALFITMRSLFTTFLYSASKAKTFLFCKGRKKSLLSSLNKTNSLLSFSVNTKRRESPAQDLHQPDALKSLKSNTQFPFPVVSHQQQWQSGQHTENIVPLYFLTGFDKKSILDLR